MQPVDSVSGKVGQSENYPLAPFVDALGALMGDWEAEDISA